MTSYSRYTDPSMREALIASQRVPSGEGLLTTAKYGGMMLPSSGVTEMLGYYPDPEGTGYLPSTMSLLSEGKYGDVGYQVLGGLGDLLYAASPVIPPLAVPAASAKAARAGKFAKKAAEARAEELSKLNEKRAVKEPTKIEKDPRGYSKIELDKPIEEYEFDIEPIELSSERKIVRPEDVQNQIFISGAGDLSGTGILKGLLGQTFDEPVNMYGGRNYGLLTPYGWGSDKVITTKLRKNALNAQREHFEKTGEILPVNLGFTTMNPVAIDFQSMQAEALAEQLKLNPVTKEAAKVFDEQFKKIDPNFVGVNSPDLRKHLSSLSGSKKLHFSKLMDKSQFKKLGFPEVGVSRYAMTEEELRNAPVFSGGLSFYRMDLDSPNITDPVFIHPSFNTAMPRTGDIMGFGEPIPNEIFYRDWFNDPRNLISAKGEPLDKSQSIYSFGSKTVKEEEGITNPYQVTDQEWVDTISGLLGM